MSNRICSGLVACLVLIASGCATQQSSAPSDRNLTVGVVQKEIKVGMNSSDVVEALGSPNMVTTDEQRREVWVDDKISTEYARKSQGAGVNLLILGFGQDKASRSTTQKTLTVVVKFDDKQKVRDFSYHTSKF